MKNLIIAVLAIAFAVTACDKSSKQSSEKLPQSDTVAYQIGVFFGGSLITDFPDLNTEIVANTITEVFKGTDTPPFASQQEAGMYIQKYMMKKNDSLYVASQDQVDSVALGLGYYYGSNLSKDFAELDIKLVNKGLIEAFNGKEEKMFNTDQDANTFIQNYIKAKQAVENEKYKIEGEEFLAKNAKKAGITVTESGLQYEVLREGDGPKPQSETDKVRVTYHGTLIDGETVFDSSVERGDTVSFALNQVIKGWTEGVQLMNIGSKYRFYVPTDLAYGANPRPGVIKPYMALIFDVELFGINEE